MWSGRREGKARMSAVGECFLSVAGVVIRTEHAIEAVTFEVIAL